MIQFYLTGVLIVLTIFNTSNFSFKATIESTFLLQENNLGFFIFSMHFFKNFILFFVLNVFKPLCVFQKFEKLNPFFIFFVPIKKLKHLN